MSDNNSSNKNDWEERSNRKNVNISKFMSWILRHGLNERNIKYDNEGYILLADLLSQPEMKDVTLEQIRFVVDNNDKKRFTLITKSVHGTDNMYIKANQGHSKDIGSNLDDSLALEKITDPSEIPICVHGTTKKALKTIQSSSIGLSPMGRKHVHLASGLPEDKDVVSGMRNSSKVVIFINVEEAMKRGKTFYRSTNGVILTPDNIEPDLFSKIDYR